MDGAFGLSRRKRRLLINIAPLIDVMFLLLIFFMVSSTFRETMGIDVALPDSSSAEEQAPADLRIYLDAEGQLMLEDAPAPQSVEAVTARVTAFLEEHPEGWVLLNADAAAQAQRVVDVFDAVREAGGEGVILSTEP